MSKRPRDPSEHDTHKAKAQRIAIEVDDEDTGAANAELVDEKELEHAKTMLARSQKLVASMSSDVSCYDACEPPRINHLQSKDDVDTTRRWHGLLLRHGTRRSTEMAAFLNSMVCEMSSNGIARGACKCIGCGNTTPKGRTVIYGHDNASALHFVWYAVWCMVRQTVPALPGPIRDLVADYNSLKHLLPSQFARLTAWPLGARKAIADLEPRFGPVYSGTVLLKQPLGVGVVVKATPQHCDLMYPDTQTGVWVLLQNVKTSYLCPVYVWHLPCASCGREVD